MNKILQKNKYKFLTSISTRWGDMDGLRHINHAAYFSYMETARMEWLNSLGFVNKRWDSEVGVILASAKIDYFTQIHHPERFEIGILVSRLGTKSFDLLTGIFKGDDEEPIAQATFILVSFNYHLNKSIPVPEIIKKYLI